MFKWITKIHWGKTLFVAFLITILETIVHMVEAIVMMPYYQMPQYFGLWSKLMMPTAGPPPPEFMIVSIVSNFFTGVALVLIYYYIREYLPKEHWKRTWFFADILVATSFLFFTVPTALLFNMPYALAVSWFVSSFVILAASSTLIVKFIR